VACLVRSGMDLKSMAWHGKVDIDLVSIWTGRTMAEGNLELFPSDFLYIMCTLLLFFFRVMCELAGGVLAA